MSPRCGLDFCLFFIPMLTHRVILLHHFAVFMRYFFKTSKRLYILAGCVNILIKRQYIFKLRRSDIISSHFYHIFHLRLFIINPFRIFIENDTFHIGLIYVTALRFGFLFFLHGAVPETTSSY
jgi:hypothetical protein